MRQNWRRGIDRGGEVTSPSGLGAQPLRIQSCAPIHMSPLWGFGCLLYAVFYKHAAPLGLNAVRICGAVSIVGERLTYAQRVGRPNPYTYSFGCSRSNFHVSRFISPETAASASP